MKITMLRTEPGADDGFTVVTYRQGDTYEVGDSLARAFVHDMGAAEAVEEEDVVVIGGAVEEDVVAAVVPEQAETTSTRPTHQTQDLAYLTKVTAARHSNLFHRHSQKGENPTLCPPK